MIQYFVFAVAILASSSALGQSFSCRIGATPACLDYGDKVCSSMGKCVDANAACFDTYQCNYEGFTCRSNVTICIENHDDLLEKHNALVRDYNDLLKRAKRAEAKIEDVELCIRWATTLDDAQGCF